MRVVDLDADRDQHFPRIASKDITRLSPWVQVSAKHLQRVPGGETAVYHSLVQSDYVGIFAVRPDGVIPLVRQYRPAMERFTYELPAGLVDRDVPPATVAVNEVHEETGYKVMGEPHLLGCLCPDTGRLENKLWAYFANIAGDVEADWVPEAGVDVVPVRSLELRDMIRSGQFDHALHIGIIGLALTEGLFTWDM